MAFCEAHSNAHCPMCPVCMMQERDSLRSELDKHRWIPAEDGLPDDIDMVWDKKVLALECESKIPRIMTMAEILLDEGSEVEYWKPIILPAQALQKGGE